MGFGAASIGGNRSLYKPPGAKASWMRMRRKLTGTPTSLEQPPDSIAAAVQLQPLPDAHAM